MLRCNFSVEPNSHEVGGRVVDPEFKLNVRIVDRKRPQTGAITAAAAMWPA
jgi:hypothetical protein